MQIIHHGAVNGVTGSCHQLDINDKTSVLIDCGLFQGAETAGRSSAEQLKIDFDIDNISALIITHCHIDHVGRIPYLLAAGFNKPIFATTATAALLPIVIEDALKVGVTKNSRLITLYLDKLKQLLKPVDYGQWFELPMANGALGYQRAKAKFKPAGHILGSAYVEIALSKHTEDQKQQHRVVFSGDLGATYTPLLASPKSPYRADTLVIESTYGDKNHQGRKQRSKVLKALIEKAVSDNGIVLIPAFSIGRTQELLYEFEQIIHQHQANTLWQNIEIIIDSPMAANFTEQYQKFKQLWDKEARQKVKRNRHPLDFSQLYTIGDHQQHLSVIDYLSKRHKPAIIIAASGMCTGGRIVNYLKAFLNKTSTDILFVGYQAQGTTGREIQQYGPGGGYVFIDGEKITIKAQIHTISGYSAHADQHNLINFVKRIYHKPKHIKIVHGDEQAKQALASAYKKLLPDTKIEIARE